MTSKINPESLPQRCQGCGLEFPCLFQIAFCLRNQEEHRLDKKFSEPAVWGFLSFMKQEFEHGHLQKSLAITVAGGAIVPEEIELIKPVKAMEEAG